MSAKRQAPPQGIDLVERAMFLLRAQPASVWAVQAAGAAPLLLSVLYFVFDSTAPGIDPARLVSEAFLCAVCFLWFNVCRARFAQLLLSALSDQPPGGWKRAVDTRALAIQSCKLFAMPLAALAVFPLAWTVSFFRSGVVFSGREPLFRATKMAGVWQRQTWAALVALALFSVIVFLNLLILLALLPTLARIFSGSENAFTRLGAGVNGTVFAIALGFTWLLTDPLYQAVFCVRAFLAESRETGRDLMFTLRHLALITLALIAIAPHAHGQPAPRVTPEQLDASVNHVLEQREYAWRLPRTQQADSGPGLIERIFVPVRRAIRSAIRWIVELLQKLFRSNQSDSSGKAPPFPAVRWTMAGLIVLFAVAAGFALVRLTRKRETAPEKPPVQTLRPIQLDDERISATDLPEDRWIEMGRECLTRGEYRLALRAFYLANLSWLGRRDLLTIAPFKSNRDYWRELRRRAPAEELQQAFSENIRAFERGWYGTHPVDAGQVNEFERTFLRMRGYVEA